MRIESSCSGPLAEGVLPLESTWVLTSVQALSLGFTILCEMFAYVTVLLIQP